jgi:hypothetical protein
MKGFKHGALQNADISIRLLKIEPDDDADEVRYSLNVAAKDDFSEIPPSLTSGENQMCSSTYSLTRQDFKRDRISVYYYRF